MIVLLVSPLNSQPTLQALNHSQREWSAVKLSWWLAGYAIDVAVYFSIWNCLFIWPSNLLGPSSVIGLAG